VSDDAALDAQTYRRLLLTHYDWSRLYDRETLADWLDERDWSVRQEDADATGRDRTTYVVSKRSTHIRGLGGPEALFDIANEEGLTLDGVQIAVIEHAGGPDWPEEGTPKVHPPPGSDLRR
jgi:hypothetical protein